MNKTSSLPPSVARLIDAFAQLPGIGPKSASRLAYHLLRAPLEHSMMLADALRDLKARTKLCSRCYNITESDPCEICMDEKRDQSLICVVEEPLDVSAIERVRSFNGVFHVLHGVISPMNGLGPDDLKINELIARIAKQATSDEPVREIILATNPMNAYNLVAVSSLISDVIFCNSQHCSSADQVSSQLAVLHR